MSEKPRDDGDRDARASDVPQDLVEEREVFVRSFLKKGVEYTELLLHENQDLREELTALRRDNASLRAQVASDDAIRDLLRTVERLEKERKDLLARSAELEESRRQYEGRAQEIEQEVNDLANLYIASSQLHAALDVRELCATIIEILLNFVGAKTFAVLIQEAPGGRYGALVAEGIAVAAVPAATPGDGVMGEVATKGHRYYDGVFRPPALDLARPAVCLPLLLRHRVVGLLPIWGFLPQKSGLVDVDRELCKLLSSHAAPALNAARRVARPAEGELLLADLRACLEEHS